MADIAATTLKRAGSPLSSHISAVETSLHLDSSNGSGKKVRASHKAKKKEKTMQVPLLPSRPNQCHFLVKRKQRYCTLPAGKDRLYCGEHAVYELAPTESELRIPCPYDNNHSVAQSKLEKHLLKCNAQPLELLYRVVNVNCNPTPESIPILSTSLRTQSLQTIHQLLDKVKLLYQEFLDHHGEIETIVLNHPSMTDTLESKNRQKHTLQQASLIGHLEKMGALQRSFSFIEFGAGKGELGLYVRRAVATTSVIKIPTAFYVVDRQNFRQKFDRYMRNDNVENDNTDTSFVFERLAIDIKDLKLSLVPSLSSHQLYNRPVVAFSKHLCGGGTDVTLHCLNNYNEDIHQTEISTSIDNIQDKDKANLSPVRAILIALCCHQLCTLDTYVNMAWLHSVGITDIDFERLKQIIGWAINGQRPHKRSNQQLADPSKNGNLNMLSDINDDEENGHHHQNTGEQHSCQEVHYSGLTHEERMEIGRQTKRLLDYGRVLWLQQHMSFQTVKLIHYIDQDISLENCALLAM